MVFKNNNILVYDIECSSLDTDTAKLKWFGAYSYCDEPLNISYIKKKIKNCGFRL